MPRLLLVEDDPELAELLDLVLTDAGYDVEQARDGQRGLHLALSRPYDVLLVDRGLPAVEGLELLARLRRSGLVTPVLVLSARSTAQDKVDGLDAGAEDYLGKPFDVGELLARLRSLLRRHTSTAAGLRVPGGVLDVPGRAVRTDDGSVVELSARECALLETLARRPQQVHSRARLRDTVFHDAEGDNVVDTYVHYCRRKLGPDVVTTVRGLGYRLGPLERR